MTQEQAKHQLAIRFVMGVGMVFGIWLGIVLNWWAFLIFAGFLILCAVLTIRDSRRVESPPQGIFLGELQDCLEPFWHDSELAMQAFDLLGKTLDKMGYSLMSGKVTEGKAHELWAEKKHVDKTS